MRNQTTHSRRRHGNMQCQLLRVPKNASETTQNGRSMGRRQIGATRPAAIKYSPAFYMDVGSFFSAGLAARPLNF